MKSASLIINGVLAVAVAILFYLHFSSSKKTDASKAAASPLSSETAPGGGCRIAYFVMDSVDNALKMMKDMRAELTKEAEKMYNDLAALQKRYNDKFTQFQSQAAKGSMSAEESVKAKQEIEQMQRSFASAQQDADLRLKDLEMRKRLEVKSLVENYLKEYNKTKGYTYIFGYEPGFMFYRDTAYDVTADLIRGLNEGYKKK